MADARRQEQQQTMARQLGDRVIAPSYCRLKARDSSRLSAYVAQALRR